MRAGFGERHVDCQATAFLPSSASRTLWTKALQGQCVAVLGKFGRGKTQMACELCRALIRMDATANPIYVTAARLMERLKRSWGGDGPDPRDAWRACKLLVIDDVHVGYDGQASGVELGDLLDARYYANKATVLIANLTPDEFEAKVGSRITSRINDGGGLVELTGEDRRGQ
jgi:DNA replication protein DnaC